MSTSKVMEEVLEESGGAAGGGGGRIQTRRSSRSTRSASPVMSLSSSATSATVTVSQQPSTSSPTVKQEGDMMDSPAPMTFSAAEQEEQEEQEEEEDNTISGGGTTTTTKEGKGQRVTRSQSVESSGYETTDSRKRKRKAAAPVTTTSKASASASPSSITSNAIIGDTTFANKKKRVTDSYQPSSHTLKSIHHNNSSNVSTPNSTATPPPSSTKNFGNNTNGRGEDSERETRTASQRISKEAREAKKAQRDILIKERLNELDKLEKAVKDGSHSEYLKLLSDIEQKRTKQLYVAEMRRSLAERNVTNFFNSQKNAAHSQYYWNKLALRRSMIQHVQQKINILEQEYYSNHVQSSLDDEHLSEWVPPDRPSMISSLTLGLSEEDAENDVEWARQDPRELIEESTNNSSTTTKPYQPYPPTSSSQQYYSQRGEKKRDSSPPIDMLASLADRQYQKDFKQESTDKSYTLPPLNPSSWR